MTRAGGNGPYAPLQPLFAGLGEVRMAAPEEDDFLGGVEVFSLKAGREPPPPVRAPPVDDRATEGEL